MKQLLIIFFLAGAISANAQSDKYTDAMKKTIDQMVQAKTVEDFQKASAAFERIGDAEKDKWLPYYYAALSLATAGWVDQNIDKDANAAKGLALLDKAKAINDNSEIYAVRNMLETQQMLVDPQNRYMTYGAQANADLEKGMQLDPNNPRLYYLKGMGIFNTPEQFGGGKEKAKPILEKAMSLFNSSQPQPLYPNWGKEQTQQALDQIK